MTDWQFCFLSDSYYKDFPDQNIMDNKEEVDGKIAYRPCFFAFRDTSCGDIIWLVPISSQYEKYKAIYDKNIQKYGRCPFIRFGEVLNKKAAFLIQNICPVTEKYIQEIYVDKNNVPIKIDNRVVQDVISNARATLSKVERGAKLIFPDIASIKKVLLEDLKQPSKSELIPDHISP